MNDCKRALINYGLELMAHATQGDASALRRQLGGSWPDHDWSPYEKVLIGQRELSPVRPGERLLSIFSVVRLSEAETQPPLLYYRPHLLDLDREALFPNDQSRPTDPNREVTWDGFARAMRKAMESGGGEALFETFYHLMYRHAWALPCAYGEEGVSLFEQWKAVAALALATGARWIEGPAESFTLVRGDFSGIQDFIYRIARPAGDATFRGVAKRLRGRSFYLTLLGDVVGDWLVRRLGLTAANLLFCGGGRFDLLMAKNTNSQQELTRCMGELETWLFETFYGELGIQFAEEDVKTTDFQDMRRVYRELEQKLDHSKAWKWKEQMSRNDFYISEKDEYHACTVCHLTSMGSPGVCLTCDQHLEIGGKLPATDWVAFVYSDPDVPEEAVPIPFERFGTTVLLMDHSQAEVFLSRQRQKSSSGVLYRLNNTDFIPQGVPAGLGLGFRFLANTAPTVLNEIRLAERQPAQPGDVLDFEEIAELSVGAKRLGVLKADVDHLGLLFSEGIEPLTISRQATLSRAMDLFFCGWINRLCDELFAAWKEESGKEHPWRDRISNLFYVLYSGGDDLFIVGPWDQTLELARQLQADFAEYACRNPNVTLSAGVIQVKPHYPVQRFARLVGSRLDQAKDAGRQRISAFAQTALWQSDSSEPGFDQLLDYAQRLTDAVGEDSLPRSFVHYLGRLYRQHFVTGTINGKPHCMFLPELHYAIKRRVRKEVAESLELIDKLWKQKMMWYAPVLVSYISLITRKE